MKSILLIPFLLFSIASFSQSFLAEFEEKLSNAKIYSIEVLDLFPAEKLDFQPTNDVRSTRKQFEHLMENMTWISSSYLSKEQKEIERPSLEKLSKDEIKIELEKAYDYVLAVTKSFDETNLNDKVDFFAGEKTKRQMFTLISDHMTHHRAQLLVYLRLNNIKPPRYKGCWK